VVDSHRTTRLYIAEDRTCQSYSCSPSSSINQLKRLPINAEIFNLQSKLEVGDVWTKDRNVVDIPHSVSVCRILERLKGYSILCYIFQLSRSMKSIMKVNAMRNEFIRNVSIINGSFRGNNNFFL
jgi:hypothetical protein